MHTHAYKHDTHTHTPTVKHTNIHTNIETNMHTKAHRFTLTVTRCVHCYALTHNENIFVNQFKDTLFLSIGNTNHQCIFSYKPER